MAKDLKTKKDYVWHTQHLSPQCQKIDCPSYDPIKDFRRDPSGFYVLIRLDFTSMAIEVAMCNKDHVIVTIFKGHKAQDIYEAIFKYEKKHRVVWFKDKGHIAYLGKELKKAELALALGQNNYYQE